MTESTYEVLYDIVSQRLQEHGEEMLYRKEVYLFSLNNEPGICDGEKLSSLSNNADFFQGAFISLLNRLPDEGVTKAWSSSIQSKKPQVFRAELMDTLLSSPEAVIKSSEFINNRITTTRIRPKQVLEALIPSEVTTGQEGNQQPAKAKEHLRMQDRLYKVYLGLPEPIRRVAHRIVRGK